VHGARRVGQRRRNSKPTGALTGTHGPVRRTRLHDREAISERPPEHRRFPRRGGHDGAFRAGPGQMRFSASMAAPAGSASGGGERSGLRDWNLPFGEEQMPGSVDQFLVRHHRRPRASVQRGEAGGATSSGRSTRHSRPRREATGWAGRSRPSHRSHSPAVLSVPVASAARSPRASREPTTDTAFEVEGAAHDEEVLVGPAPPPASRGSNSSRPDSSQAGRQDAAARGVDRPQTSRWRLGPRSSARLQSPGVAEPIDIVRPRGLVRRGASPRRRRGSLGTGVEGGALPDGEWITNFGNREARVRCLGEPVRR
jgi:hypothetical protein